MKCVDVSDVAAIETWMVYIALGNRRLIKRADISILRAWRCQQT